MGQELRACSTVVLTLGFTLEVKQNKRVRDEEATNRYIIYRYRNLNFSVSIYLSIYL